MQKIAFAHMENRIAPVFDVARMIRIIEIESGQIVKETDKSLPEELPIQKGLRLTGLGVDTLVCGAISRPMREILTAYGIKVIPFIAGALSEIIQGWFSGRLNDGAYSMPGCNMRMQFNPYYRKRKERYFMNNFGMGQGGGMGGGWGTGKGGGRGQGGGGKRRGGRMGGPRSAGPAGNCVCPQCGNREPHQRGIPCIEIKCPKCGTMMNRE